MSRTVVAALLGMCLTGPALAESKSYNLTIAAGDNDRSNTPITVLLPLPVSLGKAESEFTAVGLDIAILARETEKLAALFKN